MNEDNLLTAVILIVVVIASLLGFWAGREHAVYTWRRSEHCIIKNPGDFCVYQYEDKPEWPLETLFK